MRIKNLFLLAFLFISLSQISCKKDSSGSTNASILGKWTLLETRVKISAAFLPAPEEEVEPGNGATYEAKSDGTLIVCESNECKTEYYKITGNTITISSSSTFTDSETFDIQTLTSNSLVLYQKSNQTLQGENITTEATIKFSK